MAITIGDIFLRLLPDTKDLKPAAQKAAADAGDGAARSFGASFKSRLSGAVLLGLGSAFAIAAKGAIELENATAKFRAETGATAEEAAKAGHAIAEMSRGNLQNVATIGDVLSTVTTNMGLTGDAAAKTAQQILDWSTATGQDAVTATKSWDDTLDSWHMTADQLPGLMDQLIAGTQRYGGTVAGAQAAVVALAPAIQGLGGTFSDATGFVNLFETAGLDASAAARGLNTALSKLKPGQTLDDLIKQVSSIVDPTQRAQEAMRLFGTRSGSGLANALQPGITSLGQFVVSTTDASGATETAANVIKGTFSNQVKLAIQNVTGALAELGTQFGPAVTGFASLATLLGPTLGQVFRTLATDIGVLAAANASGVVIGGAIDAGIIAGLAVGLPVIAQMIANELKKPFGSPGSWSDLFGKNTPVPHTGLNTDTRTGVTTDAQGNVVAQAAKTGAAAGTAFAVAYGTAAADAFRAHQADAAAGVEAGYASAIAGIHQKEAELAKFFTDTGKAIGAAIPASIATGALTADKVLADGIKALRDLMKNGLSPKQLAAEALGKRFGETLAKGFASSKIGAVDAARALAVDSIAAIEKAGLKGPKASDKVAKMVGELYASGLNAKEIVIAVQTAGGNLNEDAVNKMLGHTGVGSPPYLGGQAVANSWLDGLSAAVRAGGAAHSGFSNALDYIKSLLYGHSPPVRGPLKDLPQGGYNLGLSYKQRFLAGLGISDADLRGAFQLPAIQGLAGLGSNALAVSVGTGSIVHSGTVRLEVTPDSARAFHDAGYSMADVEGLLRNLRQQSYLPVEA